MNKDEFNAAMQKLFSESERDPLQKLFALPKDEKGRSYFLKDDKKLFITGDHIEDEEGNQFDLGTFQIGMWDVMRTCAETAKQTKE